MDLTIYITKQGMERLQNRIAHLMNDERPEVIKAVAIAREFGDLSENAEYKAARERQREIDHELDYLRRRSTHLKVVDTTIIPRDAVRFGLYCLARDVATQEEVWYHIVGVEEVNFQDEEGIQAVSVVAPIGKGLFGKKVGEIAVIDAPGGERRLEVLAIR